MSNRYPKGTAGSIMADYVQRLLKKQQQQGKIQASQIEGTIGYHQMPPGSVGSDPGDTGGGSTTVLSTPTGPAGTDVVGTYPGGLVVAAIRGYIVDDVEPPDGGVLVFDLDTGHWVPGAMPPATVDNEQIDDRVSALIVAGTGIMSTYDDTAGTLTIAATGGVSAEDVDDRVNALLVAGTGIVKTYDDALGTLTLEAVGVTGPQGEPGPEGPQGPAGAANALYTETWVWNTSTAVPPNTSQVRTNSGNWAAATVLRLDRQVQDGRDITANIMAIKAGDQIRMQHRTDATRNVLYDVVSDIVAVSTYFTVTVALVSVAGVLPTNSTQVSLTLLTQGVTVPQWFTGVGDPTAAIGRVGDMYLEDDGDIWKNVNPDGWTATGTNISGADGTSGGFANPMTAAGDIIVGGTSEQVNQATPPLGAVATAINTWLSFVPANLIDGSDATVAESQSHLSAHPWFRIDLGSAKTIAAFRVLQAIGGHGASIYKIQTSPDGTTWTDVYTSPAGRNTGSGDSGAVAITETTARYWRLYLETYTTSDGGWQVHTWELLAPGLAAGNPQRLPVGTSGHILTSNGITPVWQAASGGVTVEDVDDRVNTLLVAGTGITKTYDDTANTLTLAATSGGSTLGVPRVIGVAYLAGALTVGNDQGPNLRLDTPSELVEAHVFAKVAPTGSGTTLDVKQATVPAGPWSSLFSTPLALASGAQALDVSAFAASVLAAGTYFRADVLTIPASGSPPSGVTIQLDVATAEAPEPPAGPTFVTSGLILGYAFSEGSGQTLNDLSSNNYDAQLGLLVGADTHDPTWITAGLDFDPSQSDRVVVTGVPDTGWLGAVTIMVVANFEASGSHQVFIDKAPVPGSNVPVAFGTDFSTNKLWVWRANTGQTIWEGPAPIIGSYRCYTVAADANINAAPTFYVGPTPIAGIVYGSVGTPGAATGTNSDLAIGRRGDGAGALNGVMSYLLVYNRVLSAAEIAQNYGAMIDVMAARGVTLPAIPPIITSGLILAYAMSELSGQTVNDLSPNNYNAVLGSTSSVETNDPNWVTQGLDFTRSTSDVVTASSVPDTDWLGSLSIMVVAKVDDGSQYHHFVGKHSGNGSSANPCDFRTDNAATPKLSLNRGNSGTRTYDGPAVTIGSYRCYSYTVGQNITAVPTFYVGTTPTTGVPSGITPGTDAPPTGSSQPVLIGKRADDAVKIDGVISYVLVYNRLLSAGEIATNYAALQTIMAARGVTLP